MSTIPIITPPKKPKRIAPAIPGSDKPNPNPNPSADNRKPQKERKNR